MLIVTILFATILLGCWIWIGYEIYRAPVKDDDDMDDPTTTFWHE